MKKYKINGKEFVQKPLTIAQVREFLKIIGDLDVNENTTYRDLINVLLESKLSDIMGIIFHKQKEQAEKINWEEVPYDIIDEVISDFFDLNPRLISRLRSLLESFISKVTPATAS